MERLLITILLILLPSIAFCANYAINPACGSNGDGSSWTCGTGVGYALNNLPSSLVRGNTYWLADGDYTSASYVLTFSGTGTIIIKKAVHSADPATYGSITSGWVSTLGDGQAVFVNTSIQASTSYLVIDGQVGGGPGNWKGGIVKHGIKFDVTGSSGRNVIAVTSGGTLPNLTVKHVEFDGCNTEDQESKLVYTCSAGGLSNNVTLEYNYMHSAATGVWLHCLGHDALIQYNYFGYNGRCGDAAHKELISTDAIDRFIFRYNIVMDISDTAVFGLVNPTEYDPCEDWEIYGNVFAAVLTGDGTSGSCMAPLADCYAEDIPTNWKIYNNTFINFHDQGVGTNISNANIWRNNLYYYNATVYFNVSDVRSHNTFIDNTRCGTPPCSLDTTLAGGETGGATGTANPFIDWQNENFLLTSAYASSGSAGTTLSSPYNTDAYGNVRGADGKWDRGAYEYVYTIKHQGITIKGSVIK